MHLQRYGGTELGLFENAHRWKSYLASVIAPYIKGAVLEVGAGCGGTTGWLATSAVTSWCCLEPDPKLCNAINLKLSRKELPVQCRVVCGTIDQVPEKTSFDCILYIDVLEHILNDAIEICKAAARVRNDGYLIILAPAYQSLYSPFDKTIGHFRRYNKSTMQALEPASFHCVHSRYLDSAGLLASVANKVFLRQSVPKLSQVLLWDRCIVPVSRRVDRLLKFAFGKSILVIWQRKK